MNAWYAMVCIEYIYNRYAYGMVIKTSMRNMKLGNIYILHDKRIGLNKGCMRFILTI